MICLNNEHHKIKIKFIKLFFKLFEVYFYLNY